MKMGTAVVVIVNSKKTVCMIYKPVCSSKVLNCVFPKFCLSTVVKFHMLNHFAT